MRSCPRRPCPRDALAPQARPPVSVRIVRDLAREVLTRMQLERPESDGGIGRVAFDAVAVAATVGWKWVPENAEIDA